MFLRDVPDCDDGKSKSSSYKTNEVVRTQILSTGRMSEIVRSDKPCRIEFQAHLSISGPITARTGFRKWLKIFNYFLCYNIGCLDIVCANLIYFYDNLFLGKFIALF